MVIKVNKKRVNEFLQHCKQIVLESATTERLRQERTIYHELINLGVNEGEENYEIDRMCFSRWINYFQGRRNINVFVDNNRKYFCQFVNMRYHFDNHIKVYIPIHMEAGASDSIYDAARMIFDFLEKNNIAHLSKIGKRVRFDDIVVRLTNENDARRLIEFINSNKYIRSHLIEPNPFALEVNNLAVASDGRLSYNEIVSDYILIYLEYMKEHNKLGQVNADTFIEFIKNYYQETFIKMINIEDVFMRFQIHRDNNGYVNPGTITNLKNITELIIRNFDKHFSFEQYTEFFRGITNKEQTERDNYQYQPFIYMENERVHKKNQDAKDAVTQSLLAEFINVTNISHPNDNPIQIIQRLLETNNYCLITRTYDLREKLARASFAEELRNLLQRKNTSIHNLIYQISAEYMEMDDIFQKYIIAMTRNYGRECAIHNIVSFYNMVTDPKIPSKSVPEFAAKLITREHNLRRTMTSMKFINKLQRILNEKHMTIENYFIYVEQTYDLGNFISHGNK